MSGERGIGLSKHLLKSRLGAEVLLATLCSLALSALLFVPLHIGAYRLLDKRMKEPGFALRQEEKTASRLQTFVTRHALALEDAQRLDEWAADEPGVLLTLYAQGRAIFDSLSHYSVAIPENWVEAEADDREGEKQTWEIAFADGTARALIWCFYEQRFYALTDALAALLCLGIFILLLLAFIRQKTSYIRQLEEELKILEGGDLSYPVSIKGQDELSALAAGIEAMRQAIQDRQAREEEAREANRELITAMSHDLRTPLTALMGYLDIVALNRCRDEAQRARFIEAGRKKAYQIKALSDKLFEYFLVYGKDREELSLEEVNGEELIGQVVEDSLFDMESEGFRVKREAGAVACRLRVDVESIRRVFGNVFSNLVKYADRAQPVSVRYELDGGWLLIEFHNTLDTRQERGESTNIGLKTCEEIVRRHGGTFTSLQAGWQFSVSLRLPILHTENEEPSFHPR